MDGWPKLGYNCRNTSYAPDVTTPEKEVSEEWRFGLTNGLYTSPTITEGMVYINYESEYFGEEPNVYALNVETGDIRWTVDLGRFGDFWNSPTVSDGVIYVVTGYDADSGLVALDGTDGSEIWGVEGSFGGSATFHEGVVYIGSKSGLVAIDSADGEVLWRKGKGPITYGAIPAVDRDTVFAPNGHWLQALDAKTGDLRWETHTGADQTSPVVQDQLVFTGGHDGELRAFDIEDGSVQWVWEVGEQIYEPPAVGAGSVFFGSDDGYLRAVSIEDGKLRWQTALHKWVREVTYVDESLYACSWTKGSAEENGVYTVSPDDGNIRQKIELGSSPHSPVVAADNRLFVGTVNGLVALTD